MYKLKLAQFKAFDEEISISLSNNKNLLLYGENGAGKSSLYEAIKIIFFNQKLESSLIAQTPEDLEQLKNELWTSYNNKIDNRDFKIEINDTDYKSFLAVNYQVFMISIEELNIGNKINLKELLERFCLMTGDITSLCENAYQDIQKEVNDTLINFMEQVSIEINPEDNYSVKIIDNNKNIESILDIKKYFNEAKLNIIVLLLLLCSIKVSEDGLKSRILVLDDFITSLDVSNRVFLIKYIFDKFQDTQILIFTHNISFYNLIMFILRDVYNTNDMWEFANLFEINNKHKLYIKSGIESVATIKTDFKNPGSNASVDDIGNRIRKKFEVLLYEYSKLLMIGTVEDTKNILDSIKSSKSAYYNNKLTASDLVNDIEMILLENDSNDLAHTLLNKINSYKKDGFENLKIIITELKLYQKVTMHPMSHGIDGLAPFTIKEINKSLELLERMEKFLKNIVNYNVVNT